MAERKREKSVLESEERGQAPYNIVSHAYISEEDVKLEKIKQLFQLLDKDRNDKISLKELKDHLRDELGIYVSGKDLKDLFRVMGTKDDGDIDFEHFLAFVQQREERLIEVFDALDSDGNGLISVEEIKEQLASLGMEKELYKAERMMSVADEDNSGYVDFEEFRKMAYLFPSLELKEIMRNWHDVSASFDLGEGKIAQKVFFFSPFISSLGQPIREDRAKKSFGRVIAAGAIAGTVSRTVTAPLDRLKVLFQAGGQLNGQKITGIGQGLRLIYEENGVRSFYRGNFANCVKIAPESAVKFYVFEGLKSVLAKERGKALFVLCFLLL